jgi:pre-mRNA-splicing factor CDC5/CEF1
LANTKGKKAKRKARERMLEESRRLAMLQKRRELKAAGIESKLGGNKKRNFVDYAKEIPFQKLAPGGFYDVSEENEQSRKMGLDPKKHGLELQKLEGQHEKDEQERQQQRDKKLMKELFKTNAPLAVQKVIEQSDPVSLRRRVPLDLPAPQVTDNDLEEIVKMGKGGLMGPPEGLPSSFGATNALVNDYSQVFRPPATPLRTPQQEDLVMQEARSLRALTKMTPLMMSQQNIEDLPDLSGGTGFDGVAPRKHHLNTPNPLVANTPSRQGGMRGSVAGEMESISVMSTPLGRGNFAGGSNSSSMGWAGNSVVIRDTFGLNQHSGDDSFSVSDMSSIVTHSRLDKHRNKLAQQSILAQISSLPEPEYTYDVALPSVVDVEDEDEGDDPNSVWRRSGKPEDRTDAEARVQRQRLEAEQAELRRRSTVLKRDLPRPALVTTAILAPRFSDSAEEQPATKKARTGSKTSSVSAALSSEQKLLQEEMLHIIAYEDRKYPPMFSAGQVLGEAQGFSTNIPPRFKIEPERMEESELLSAEALIRSELLKNVNLDTASMEGAVAAISGLHQQLTYLPSESGLMFPGTFSAHANKTEQLFAMKTEFMHLAAQVKLNIDSLAQLHNECSQQHSAYNRQKQQLSTNLGEKQADFQRRQADCETIKAVRDQEQKAAQQRLDRALEEALQAENLEKESQQRYANLMAFARIHGVSL